MDVAVEKMCGIVGIKPNSSSLPVCAEGITFLQVNDVVKVINKERGGFSHLFIAK